MSRQNVTVIFPDGTERYGLYNGTADVLWPALFDTPNDAWDAKDRYYDRGTLATGEFAEAFYPEPVGEVEQVIVDIDPNFGSQRRIPAEATRNAVITPINGDVIYDHIYGSGWDTPNPDRSQDPRE